MRRGRITPKDLRILQTLQQLPYEVGGAFDVNHLGLLRIILFPGVRDEVIHPRQFAKFPIIFHSHTNMPHFQNEIAQYKFVKKHLRESNKLKVDAFLQAPSPADIFATSIFFLKRVAEAMLIAANEGLYVLKINRAGIERLHFENSNFSQMWTIFQKNARDFDHASEKLIRRLKYPKNTGFSLKIMREIQKEYGREIARLINIHSEIIECKFQSWDSDSDIYLSLYMSPNRNISLNKFNNVVLCSFSKDINLREENR